MRKQFRNFLALVALFAMLTFTASIITSCNNPKEEATEEVIEEAPEAEEAATDMKCEAGKCGEGATTDSTEEAKCGEGKCDEGKCGGN